MSPIALLALEFGDANVVLTSIVLVFGMLVALCLIITLEGRLMDSASKKAPAAPAAPSPARKAPPRKPAAPAPAPAVEQGIPAEVVAAIAAAVVYTEGGVTVRSIRRVSSAAGSRRGVWGDAGVAANTTPFSA